MDILGPCLDEIGLFGLEGCTLGELWQYLSLREQPIPLQLDDHSKQYIWSQLLQCARPSPLVQLFLLPEPREDKQSMRPSTTLGRETYMEYRHPFPYRPIVSKDGCTKGSCAAYKLRRDITDEVLERNLTLGEAVEMYGDTLILVGSQDLRERALIPSNKDLCLDITHLQYCLLEMIGRARQFGLLRTDISNIYMKIDSRSTFHHVKILEQCGLIIVKSGHQRNDRRMQVVHVLFLSRFNPPEWFHSSLTSYEEFFCSILEKAPNHTMSTRELKDKMGKGYKVARSSLLKKGYIKQDTHAKVKPLFPGQKTKSYCLVKSYEDSHPEEPVEVKKEEEEEEEEEGEPDPDAQVPLVVELPVDAQGYRLIESYGPEGLYNMDFCLRGLALDRRACRQISKSLIKSSSVFTLTVDDLPRRLKLIADRHVSRNKEYESMKSEQAKSGIDNMQLAVMTGKDVFKETRVSPKEKTLKMEPEREGKGKKDCEGEGKIVGALQDGDLPTSSRQVEGQDDDVTSAFGESTRTAASRVSPAVESRGRTETPPGVEGREGGGVESAPISPVCVSPQPGQGDVVRRKRLHQHKAVMRYKLMTYKQLKRRNRIMEYMNSKRIVHGAAEIVKFLRRAESREGRGYAVDRRTILKLLNQLERDGTVIARFSTVTLGGIARKISLYHVAGVPHDDIAREEGRIILNLQGMVQRLEHRRSRKRRKSEAEVEREGEGEEESEEEEEEDDMQPVSLPNRTNVHAKFQRLRHFHYYLWILAFGTDGGAESQADQESREGDEERGEALKMETDAPAQEPPLPAFLPPNQFPWVEAVHRIGGFPHRAGLLGFNDIVNNMPMSLCTILMRVYQPPLPPKYWKYLNDPKYQNLKLHELPSRTVRKHMTRGRRDVISVTNCLNMLSQMGLIDVNRDGKDLFVQLSHSATILDTSTAQPRRSFFLDGARSLFKTIPCQLGSLADLECYWFQLQTVCLQTRIILNERSKKKPVKLEEHDGEPSESGDTEKSINDVYALPYTASSQYKQVHQSKQLNNMGFGAGGLPPLTFSHLNRNWNTLPSTSGSISTAVGDGASSEEEEEGEFFGPSNELSDLPWTSMEPDDSSDEEGGAEGGPPNLGKGRKGSRRVQGREGGAGAAQTLPAAKRPRPWRAGGEAKPGVVRVPSGMVTRHSGGRGKKRFRLSKTQEAAKRVKKARASVARYKVAMGTGMAFVRGDTEGDKATREFKLGVRVLWYPYEDNFLIMAYLTSLVLIHKDQPRVAYSQIRDALHKQYPSSKNKSSVAIQRRILYMLRKQKHLSTTVDICVPEVLEDLSVLGADGPECTFEAMMRYVLEKYRGQRRHFLSPLNILPPTLTHLHEEYELIEFEKEAVVSPDGGEEMEHRINVALLTDLIISSLGAEETTYDKYATFKLFESFPESDVKAAFDGLKTRLLIKQRHSRDPGLRGPLGTQSFKLSGSFLSNLETCYSSDLLKKANEFVKDMEGWSKAESPEEESAESAGPSARSGTLSDEPIRIEAEALQGAEVAAVADMLFANSCGRRYLTITSCEPVFPDPLFEPEQSSGVVSEEQKLLQSALAEEEEEEEEEVGELQIDEQSEAMMAKPAGTGNRLTMGGLSSLRQVGESATLKHGQLSFGLGLVAGRLLEPLEEERTVELPDPSADWDGDGGGGESRTARGSLSWEGYLQICRTHLGFSESDLEFTRAVFETVDGHGSVGLPLAALCDHPAVSSLDHSLSLDYHVQTMVNFQMVIHVGIWEPRLVTRAHAGRWMMSGGVGKVEPGVPYRPWSMVNSQEANQSLLEKYEHGVLTFIMANPGVSLRKLLDHFDGMLQPNALGELLQALEMSDHIHRYTFQPAPRLSHAFPQATSEPATAPPQATSVSPQATSASPQATSASLQATSWSRTLPEQVYFEARVGQVL